MTSYAYESSFNQLAGVTDPKGLITSYTYTAQGLPFTVTRPVDASGVAPITTYAYTSFTPAGYTAFYLPTAVIEKTTATNSVTNTTAYTAVRRIHFAVGVRWIRRGAIHHQLPPDGVTCPIAVAYDNLSRRTPSRLGRVRARPQSGRHRPGHRLGLNRNQVQDINP